MADKIARAEINPAQVTQPVLAAVYDYWKRKRGARPMPTRADIVPSELREHLGWIVIVDVMPGFEEFRYRLVGTLVNQYFLADATGKTIQEAFADYPPHVANAVTGVHRKAARDKVVLRTHGAPDWMSSGYEAFDSLYLPLSDDGTTCNVLLTAFVFDREQVLLSRQIARANGGRLPTRPPRTGS
jgi:hypothetical protein